MSNEEDMVAIRNGVMREFCCLGKAITRRKGVLGEARIDKRRRAKFGVRLLLCNRYVSHICRRTDVATHHFARLLDCRLLNDTDSREYACSVAEN